jgi:hypothetical protein
MIFGFGNSYYNRVVFVMGSFNANLSRYSKYDDLLWFFDRIDTYLLEDLMRLNSLKDYDTGKCHFPMTLTIITAMDLLGTFAYGKRRSDDRCFRTFVRKYMPVAYLPYAEIIFKIARHGSAHYYFQKDGIAILRNSPGLHLQMASNINCFCIDLDILYKDFLNAQMKSRADIEESIGNSDKKYIAGFDSLLDNLQSEITNLTASPLKLIQEPFDILKTGASTTSIIVDSGVSVISVKK